MIVNKQKKIVFRNECGCIVDYELLENSILWFQKRPTAQNKKIYLHACYPCVSIHNKKVHVHRLIMSFLNKRILKTDEYVHHINHNKLDAGVYNLEIIESSLHQSHHNKGKRLTESHKIKIGAANKKRVGTKMKKRVNISLIELKELLLSGKTINSISKHFNCDWSTIKNRIYENPELLEQQNG